MNGYGVKKNLSLNNDEWAIERGREEKRERERERVGVRALLNLTKPTPHG